MHARGDKSWTILCSANLTITLKPFCNIYTWSSRQFFLAQESFLYLSVLGAIYSLNFCLLFSQLPLVGRVWWRHGLGTTFTFSVALLGEAKWKRAPTHGRWVSENILWWVNYELSQVWISLRRITCYSSVHSILPNSLPEISQVCVRIQSPHNVYKFSSRKVVFRIVVHIIGLFQKLELPSQTFNPWDKNSTLRIWKT